MESHWPAHVGWPYLILVNCCEWKKKKKLKGNYNEHGPVPTVPKGKITIYFNDTELGPISHWQPLF